MNPRSSKAKGRRLQNALRDLLRIAFPSLEEDDIKGQTMGMPGEDIVLSPLDILTLEFNTKYPAISEVVSVIVK